jgi:hypothetical protein
VKKRRGASPAGFIKSRSSVNLKAFGFVGKRMPFAVSRPQARKDLGCFF